MKSTSYRGVNPMKRAQLQIINLMKKLQVTDDLRRVR
jgi:hypothetical protein